MHQAHLTGPRYQGKQQQQQNAAREAHWQKSKWIDGACCVSLVVTGDPGTPAVAQQGGAGRSGLWVPLQLGPWPGVPGWSGRPGNGGSWRSSWATGPSTCLHEDTAHAILGATGCPFFLRKVAFPWSSFVTNRSLALMAGTKRDEGCEHASGGFKVLQTEGFRLLSCGREPASPMSSEF